MEQQRILVIDAEPQSTRYLCSNLRARDYAVIAACSGREGLKRAGELAFDIVILDLLLPDSSGFDICKAIRQQSDVAIMVLCALSQRCDIIRALDLGADDYLTKPFDLEEFFARMRAVLRRTSGCTTTQLHAPVVIGDLVLDFAAHHVLRHGKPVPLTRTEYKILAHLATHSGRVLTHQSLLQAVWGAAYGNENEYLWTYIRRLRHKLEPDPHQPRYLLTQPGVGYYLAVEEP
jgi:two-component system KDP operon response regulator KdpE